MIREPNDYLLVDPAGAITRLSDPSGVVSVRAMGRELRRIWDAFGGKGPVVRAVDPGAPITEEVRLCAIRRAAQYERKHRKKAQPTL